MRSREEFLEGGKQGNKEVLRDLYYQLIHDKDDERVETRSNYYTLDILHSSFYWSVSGNHTITSLLLYHYGVRSNGWINLCWQRSFLNGNFVLSKFLHNQGVDVTSGGHRPFHLLKKTNNPLSIASMINTPFLLPFHDLPGYSSISPQLTWHVGFLID